MGLQKTFSGMRIKLSTSRASIYSHSERFESEIKILYMLVRSLRGPGLAFDESFDDPEFQCPLCSGALPEEVRSVC